MRLKDYPEKPGKRVWLGEREIQELITEAQSPRQKAAFLLGARCGLRRKEILDVTPTHIRETEVGTMLRVWKGKGDKYRELPAPPELVTIVETLGHDIAPDEAVVDVTGTTVYRWIQRAAERRYADSGDKGWTYLDVHDLRRTWGVRLLEDGVLPSVVFEWGGWEDWITFRDHYLAEFSPEALRRERSKVDYLREPGMERVENSANADYPVVRTSAAGFSRGQPQG